MLYALDAIGKAAALCLASPAHNIRQAASCAGGHVGGEDAVRVPVEVFAGSAVPHGGTRISMPGRDLDVAKIGPSVKHGRHERVPERTGWQTHGQR